jgi:hypothetical protein
MHEEEVTGLLPAKAFEMSTTVIKSITMSYEFKPSFNQRGSK